MTKALTDDALANDSAAAPVVDPAPEEVGEVSDGSTPSGTVEANRFNGLMAQYQKALDRNRSLETELNTLKESPPVPEADSTLSNEVAELRRMLVEERVEKARTQALIDYPEVKPLADLIVGESPEDIRNMAKTIAERLRGAKPSVETPAPTTDPTTPTGEVTPAPTTETIDPPVTAPGQSVAGEDNADERVKAALAKGKSGFGEYLQAKWDSAAQRGQLEGLDTQVA